MIVGLGSDICNINRIDGTWQKFGSRFLRKFYGAREILELNAMLENKPRYVASLAKRFAAKEAFVKALGTGFVGGISWAEIEVIHQPNGKPMLLVEGVAAEVLQQTAPSAKLLLSLSDDAPFAQAVVIIEQC